MAEIVLNPFKIVRKCQQVSRSLESVLVTRQLGLQIRFDSLLPPRIMGDRHRIRQVCLMRILLKRVMWHL